MRTKFAALALATALATPASAQDLVLTNANVVDVTDGAQREIGVYQYTQVAPQVCREMEVVE